MTEDTIAFRELMEKSPDADFLREMIDSAKALTRRPFFAQPIW